jgi:HSP20 family protein
MKAERKSEHETTTDTVHRLERSYGSVSRRLLLPKNADMSLAKTHFANGVLTVTVPKHVEMPPTSRKLTVNTA